MSDGTLDEFLAPLRRLVDAPHLAERVRGLESYYEGFRTLHSYDPAVTALLSRYENLFRGIDAKETGEKLRLLRDVIALATESGVSAEGLETMAAFLAKPLSSYRGIGPKLAALLAKKGFSTVRDALLLLPSQYLDKRSRTTIRELQAGSGGYFIARVVDSKLWIPRGFPGRRVSGYTATVSDGTGFAVLKWFYPPPPFLRELLKPGSEISVFGRVDVFRGQREIHHPEVEAADHQRSSGEQDAPGVLPIYSGLPQGMSGKMYRRMMRDIVAEGRGNLKCLVPPAVGRLLGIVAWGEALANVHFPGDDFDGPLWSAHRSSYHLSLICQELFLLNALFMDRKRHVRQIEVTPLNIGLTSSRRVLERLKYDLTGAQRRVLDEIRRDLGKGHPMRRLLQGDVGSGKTVVALLAALMVIDAGRQVTLMAPTEILAEQHYLNFKRLLEGMDIAPELIVSGMRKKVKDAALARVGSGECPLVVGTHALIQDQVAFRNLGLAIIDEQHRFGVDQRSVLLEKGTETPHALYMTATPIPRTLCMTVHGDLDLSVIDEVPPGRKPARTLVFPDAHRERVFSLIDGELALGRQAYVVYPVIEEENSLDLKAATQMYEVIRERFAGNTAALLHGRMKQDEKAAVMEAFSSGRLGILVSTTVIEVGVDVPNATIMVIEHGERFGLSQLHQLRGRIGRGDNESQCVVLVDTKKLGDKARDRLIFFRDTTDGFKLAEFDLRLRGPGELLGTRQSGVPGFNVVDLVRDGPLVETVRQAAERYFGGEGRETASGDLDGVVRLYFGRQVGYAVVG